MQMSDLRPAGEFAQQYGVKAVTYGPPGSGKTPVLNTAPRPLLLAVEPGLLSMRGSTVPTWFAPTHERLDEFFRWFFNSHEAANFDTLGVDSGSQIAEIELLRELDPKRNKDGRAAYGKMSMQVMEWMNGLFFMRQKHIYIVTKEGVAEDGKKRPFFPGQDLNTKIPHLFDLIMRLSKTTVPGMQGIVPAFRTSESFEAMARDRSGRLAELEEPNLSKLFSKIMGV